MGIQLRMSKQFWKIRECQGLQNNWGIKGIQEMKRISGILEHYGFIEFRKLTEILNIYDLKDSREFGRIEKIFKKVKRFQRNSMWLWFCIVFTNIYVHMKLDWKIWNIVSVINSL